MKRLTFSYTVLTGQKVGTTSFAGAIVRVTKDTRLRSA